MSRLMKAWHRWRLRRWLRRNHAPAKVLRFDVKDN